MTSMLVPRSRRRPWGELRGGLRGGIRSFAACAPPVRRPRERSRLARSRWGSALGRVRGRVGVALCEEGVVQVRGRGRVGVRVRVRVRIRVRARVRLRVRLRVRVSPNLRRRCCPGGSRRARG